MNKQILIEVQRKIQGKKTYLKSSLATTTDSKNSGYVLDFPQSPYTPRDYTNADQWYFNGFLIRFPSHLILVDPGVDFYSRFSTTNYNINEITALVITHNHIDHSASMCIFIEKILKFNDDICHFYISKDTFDTKVPKYLQDKLLKEAGLERLHLLEDNNKKPFDLPLGDRRIVFQPLFHTCPDTFGFKIKINDDVTVGHVSDTGYAKLVKTNTGSHSPEVVTGAFESIVEKHEYVKTFYSDVTDLTVNINALDYNKHTKFHLSGWDVLDICQGSKVKKVILQHISSVNAEGEDSNYLYKLFFMDQPYATYIPHYCGRTIDLLK